MENRASDIGGAEYKGFVTNPAEQPSITSEPRATAADEAEQRAAEAMAREHRWDPPRYEIGLQGGYLRYPSPHREVVAYLAIPQDLADPSKEVYAAGLANQFEGGWTAGISATLNTWHWLSNQFTYSYERGRYDYAEVFTKPQTELIEGKSGLVTRQFDYNLLINARPRTSRWRPYAAIGPAMVVTSLSDAPIKKAAGPFKLGLKNVGLIVAAFESGNTPPLDGGAVYSIGLVYGAGIHYRVRPRITISADFRETWSRNPQFINDSYTHSYFDEQGYNTTINRSGSSTAKFRQQRFTLEAAFTF